mmetsp:Transcript_136873/g.266235  ORF Transcript_136873/g.266235 Transcript_136873/m.266235 type:complete len:536 (+) Transcript_136873:180-1787(+)
MDATEQTPLMQGRSGTSSLTSRLRRAVTKEKLSGAIKATAKLKQMSKKKDQQMQGRSAWPWYSFLNSMLRPHSHRWQAKAFRSIITVLILLNMLAFIFESEKDIAHKYHTFFAMLEGVSSVVFIVEYALRFYFAPERVRFKSPNHFEARVKFMVSVDSAIDVLSFLPWLIEVVSPLDLPNLSVLRVVRLFRLLKAAPVMGSFDVVARVLYYNAEILCVALLICAVMILTMATLLYYMRPEDNKDFSSILATVYMAVMMLTGQGGPEGDLPWYTKVVVIMTAIFAVAQFAIPASMLTWGFEQEAQRRIVKRAEENKKQAAKLLSGEMDRVSSSSSDEGRERWREWDEYEDVVVGGSDSETDGEGGGQPVKMFEGLMLREQTRAAKIFGLLDDDDDDRIATSDLIVTSELGNSDSLLASKLDPDGDGITTIEDFMVWLAHIKSRFPSSVFSELLKGLELRVKQPSQKEAPTPSRQAAATLPVAAAEQQPSFVGMLASQQLRAFADQYEALEKEVARLQTRNQALEEELACVKSDVQP